MCRTCVGHVDKHDILRVSDSTRCFPLIKSSKLERFTLHTVLRCAEHLCFTFSFILRVSNKQLMIDHDV